MCESGTKLLNIYRCVWNVYKFPLLLYPEKWQKVFLRISLQPQEFTRKGGESEGDRSYKARVNGCMSV